MSYLMSAMLGFFLGLTISIVIGFHKLRRDGKKTNLPVWLFGAWFMNIALLLFSINKYTFLLSIPYYASCFCLVMDAYKGDKYMNESAAIIHKVGRDSTILLIAILLFTFLIK